MRRRLRLPRFGFWLAMSYEAMISWEFLLSPQTAYNTAKTGERIPRSPPLTVSRGENRTSIIARGKHGYSQALRRYGGHRRRCPADTPVTARFHHSCWVPYERRMRGSVATLTAPSSRHRPHITALTGWRSASRRNRGSPAHTARGWHSAWRRSRATTCRSALS